MELTDYVDIESLSKHPDSVYLVDTNRKIKFWNNNAEKLTGYKSSDIIGHSCYDDILVHVNDEGQNLCNDGCPLFDTMMDGHERCVHVYLHHKDGHRVPVDITSAVVKTQEGLVLGAIEIFREAKEELKGHEPLKKAEGKGDLDPLTDLPNRKQLETKLQSSIKAYDNNDIPFGVILVDVDHFDVVNNTYGEATADKTLKMVAKTLESNIRPTDMVGRLEEDKFLINITYCTMDHLEMLSKKLKMLIENSFQWFEGEKMHVTVTTGAALPVRKDTVAHLIGSVRGVLERGKKKARNSVYVDVIKEVVQEDVEEEKEKKVTKKKKTHKERSLLFMLLSGINPAFYVLLAVMGFVLVWIWLVFVR